MPARTWLCGTRWSRRAVRRTPWRCRSARATPTLHTRRPNWPPRPWHCRVWALLTLPFSHTALTTRYVRRCAERGLGDGAGVADARQSQNHSSSRHPPPHLLKLRLEEAHLTAGRCPAPGRPENLRLGLRISTDASGRQRWETHSTSFLTEPWCHAGELTDSPAVQRAANAVWSVEPA